MHINTITCPICFGTGKIAEPFNTPPYIKEQKIKMVKQLRMQGFSIREIMRIMNYKSPLSIQILLKEEGTAKIKKNKK